jgi:hypothetical protein
LAVGSHNFQVRARESAGNPDPTPANQTWTVEAPEPLVTSIVAGSGRAYLRDILKEQQKLYIDRDYTFTGVPEKYVGQELIVTANDDGNESGQGFLAFDLSFDATVYVLLDARAVRLPAWLVDGTWTMTGDAVETSDGLRRIFEKDFGAGTVELGGNAMAPMTGADSNYNVVTVAAGPAAH